MKKVLGKIIEEKILPKSPLKELSGFQRSVEIPLLGHFSDEETESILTHFGTFRDLLADRIESSIPASFPKIGLRRGRNHIIALTIEDPRPEDIAAEWKWKD